MLQIAYWIAGITVVVLIFILAYSMTLTEEECQAELDEYVKERLRERPADQS